MKESEKKEDREPPKVLLAKPMKVDDAVELSEQEVLALLQRIHKELNRLASGELEKTDFRQAFRPFDRDGSGTIDTAGFVEGLKSLKINLGPNHAKQLSSVFDADLTGSVDFEEFTKFCESTDIQKAIEICRKAREKKRSSKLEDSELVGVIENIHKEIHRLAAGSLEKLDFKKVFESMDSDSSGDVDQDEFLAGLVGMGFDVGKKQVKQISEVFDADGTGKVDYAEFATFCETENLDEAVRIAKKAKARKKMKKRKL